MPELAYSNYWILAIGAAGIGFSKTGFSGVSMLHVVLYAMVFGAKESIGVVLPLLIVGDCCSVVGFGRKAEWSYFRSLVPPIAVGIFLGWWMLRQLNTHVDGGTSQDAIIQPVIGGIILALSGIQFVRMISKGQTGEPVNALPSTGDPSAPQLAGASQDEPNGKPTVNWPLAVFLGVLAGFTTMIGNAAGPVVALYFLAMGVRKYQFIGTSAWLFLCVNIFKIPLSFQLGLITQESLRVDASVFAFIPIGFLLGRYCVNKIPQRAFDILLLLFTAIAAIRLLVT
jgi:hypothetical protein